MASKPTEIVKNKGGRPPKGYDAIIAGKIHSLLTFGIPYEDISKHVGLSKNTLKKYYSEIIENTVEDRDNSVRHALYYQATKLNIPASTIFYCKTRLSKEYFEEPKIAKDDISANDEILEVIADELPD